MQTRHLWTIAAPAALATLAAALAVPLAGASAKSAVAPDRCASGDVPLGRAVEVVEAWRAFKGADGLSHVEAIKIPGKTGTYYGGKVTVTQFDLGTPSHASIVYGQPNMEIPVHPAPYRETFILLSGSSRIILSNGEIYPLKPGSMFVAEDLGTPGRGGKSGPCGYVALSLAYKDAPH